MLALLALAGCGRAPDRGPVAVSVIGGAPVLADPARRDLDPPSRVLADAVAQGLVRFDAAGQIEPGIAERWTVIDNGMSYIFRLRDARWADGAPVTAAEVAAALRRQLARDSRNPLLPFLSAVQDVVEMTPEVIEVRLSRPRPDLLKLFAQPELAVARQRSNGGTGPFRLASRSGAALLLRPALDAAADPDAARPTPEDEVRLRGEAAARSVARFAAGHADLVLGGSFADWPLVGASGAAPADVRVDPAAGLFGLAIVSREGFLADPANRDALASVFDREAIAASFGQWTPADTIVPDMLDSAVAPNPPAWAAVPLDQRRSDARARVQAWQAGQSGPLVLRIALPPGPGATLLWGHIGAALLGVGITPERVAMDAPAELRLVDAVAPYDSARWYLATACRPCGPEAAAALDVAREAPTLPARAQALAAAEAAVAADAPFITLARPLRWSLVGARLREWQPNARAWHPLNHLRNDPT